MGRTVDGDPAPGIGVHVWSGLVKCRPVHLYIHPKQVYRTGRAIRPIFHNASDFLSNWFFACFQPCQYADASSNIYSEYELPFCLPNPAVRCGGSHI